MTIYGASYGLDTAQVCEALETLAAQIREGNTENLELGKRILDQYEPETGMSWYKVEMHTLAVFGETLPLIKGESYCQDDLLSTSSACWPDEGTELDDEAEQVR